MLDEIRWMRKRNPNELKGGIIRVVEEWVKNTA
jgi:hypothetical protein